MAFLKAGFSLTDSPRALMTSEKGAPGPSPQGRDQSPAQPVRSAAALPPMRTMAIGWVGAMFVPRRKVSACSRVAEQRPRIASGEVVEA